MGKSLMHDDVANSDCGNAIAVIGFAVKLPHVATDTEGFWNLLTSGASARTEVPPHRRDTQKSDLNHNTTTTVRFYWETITRTSRDKRVTANEKKGKFNHGHFIAEPLDLFDASFFGITPQEARSMDPQQRLLLETSYHALENAGLSIDHVRGSNTSVFSASFMNDYKTITHMKRGVFNAHSATGNADALLSNRISWFYNLLGPSITLNTACSSSLVALHLACESLRSGETTMGLVCGSNLILANESTSDLANLGVLSPDGICYSFDDRANGYARGEGIACLIIKPAERAIKDGNAIRAIIRGTGVNSNGKTKNITRPNGESQFQLMNQIYRRFDLDSTLTRYVEAHGTGTAVGDPIEVEAIERMFGPTKNSPLYIGSVKSNIGHLEAAAGLAGVIKAILMLEKGVIPPTIHLQHANASFNRDWGLKFPKILTDWPRKGLRRASVNSFGFGGTNAHAVLDDAASFLENGYVHKDTTALSDEQDEHFGSAQSHHKLLIWSAAAEGGLVRVLDAHKLHALKHSPIKESVYHCQLAHTLASHRSHLAWRTYSVCEAGEEFEPTSNSATFRRASPKPRICFIFTGYSSQWTSLGEELLCYKVFHDSLRNSNDILRDMDCQFSIFDVFEFENKSAVTRSMETPEIGHPVSTAIQIALVDLLRHWRIEPNAVLGHSSGEIAAAYCGGAISKNFALRLAFFRGIAAATAVERGIQRGAMMNVHMSFQEFEAMADIDSKFQNIEVASINSPKSVTVTGRENDIHQLASTLKSMNRVTQNLQPGIAYQHSRLMQESATTYHSLIETMHSSIDQKQSVPSSRPLIASSTRVTVFGSEDDVSEFLSAEYWVENFIRPAHFSKALDRLAGLLALKSPNNAELDTHFVEIGPDSGLELATQETLGLSWGAQLAYSSMLVQHQPAQLTAMNVAGRMHCSGVNVDIDAVNDPLQGSQRHCKGFLVDLPPYPFDHSKGYWLKSNVRVSKAEKEPEVPHDDLMNSTIPSLDCYPSHWSERIVLPDEPWLRDHKIGGSYLYPAAGMLLMVIKACRQVRDAESLNQISNYRFKHVAFSRSIVIPESQTGVQTRLHMRQIGHESVQLGVRYQFHIYACYDEEWTECSQGEIVIETQGSTSQTKCSEMEDYTRLLRCCHTAGKPEVFYKDLAASGLEYGPAFQLINQVWYGINDQGIASIAPSRVRTSSDPNSPLIHLATLDGIFQAIFAGLLQSSGRRISTLVPTAVDDFRISPTIIHSEQRSSNLLVSAQHLSVDKLNQHFNFSAFDEDYKQLVASGNITLTSIGDVQPMIPEYPHQVSLYHLKWKPSVHLLLPNSNLLDSPIIAPLASSSKYKDVWLKEFACYKAMETCLKILDESAFDETKLPSHLQKYLDWIRHQMVSEDLIARIQQNAKEIEYMKAKELNQCLQSLGPEGILISKLSQSLPQILRAEEDPLQVLFTDSALADYYRTENPSPTVFKGVRQYIDCIAHENPDMAILEIGGGTGGMTGEILDVLHAATSRSSEGHHSPRFTSYTFTDISRAFFGDISVAYACKGFACQVLDIEKDPEIQDVAIASYDLVIAGNVLHATKCLSTTLNNVRKLLRPNGKLLLVEGVDPESLRLGFVFGSLPGWWLSTEPFRRTGPLISTTKWDEILSEQSFTGVDLIIGDDERTDSLACAMVSTAKALPTSSTKDDPEVKLLVMISEESALQRKLARSLQRAITSPGWHVEITDMQFDCDLANSICVILQTLDGFNFGSPKNDQFEALKKVVRNMKRGIWLIQQERIANTSFYNDGFSGFARSIISEHEDANILTLGLDDYEDLDGAVQRIITVVHQLHNGAGTSTLSSFEEIRVLDGRLCIGRLIPATDLEIAILRKQTLVNTDAISTRPSIFEANATYIIAGGLGGLGESIAKWMITRGARNFVLLSRKEETRPQAVEVIRRLKALGANAFVSNCDVSDQKRVQAMIQECRQRDSPPIRGCIQSSMVLKSAMFQNMSLDDWNETLRPKVQGSLNLIKHLPADLDFTILLSSVCGIIGASGQSNYAYACAYQDALARHQAISGKRAVSIDLGLVEDVGYSANNHQIASFMGSLGLESIPESYLHAMLEYYCDSRQPPHTSDEAQVIAGIMTGNAMQRRSIIRPKYLSRPLMRYLDRKTVDGQGIVNLSLEKTTGSLKNHASCLAPVGYDNVLGAICNRLSQILAVEEKEIDCKRPLHAYGVDSLVAIEIRAWFQQILGKNVPVSEILSNVSIEMLAQRAVL